LVGLPESVASGEAVLLGATEGLADGCSARGEGVGVAKGSVGEGVGVGVGAGVAETGASSIGDAVA